MKVSKHIPAKVFGLVALLTASTAFAQIPPSLNCPGGGTCDNPAPCGFGRCADLDHDGLCDSWEVAGGIDLKARFGTTDLVVLRITKEYLPAFQPSKQVTSYLVRARKSLIFPSSMRQRSVIIVPS